MVLDAVRLAYAAGLCLLPTRDDGSKAPAVPSWTPYLSTRPTPAQMKHWCFEHRSGFGVIAGPVSGQRECWDFDDIATYHAFVHAADACGLGDVVRRIIAGFENETPAGGRRWIVTAPADVVIQDVTLARRPGRDDEPKIKTLIELPTFAIVAPSNGGTHPSGKPYIQVSGGFTTIAAYTNDERDALLTLARSFDQMPRREYVAAVPRTTTRAAGDDVKPGDAYNARAQWPDLLPDWTEVFTRNDTTYLRRPGKTHGISATVNHGGSDLPASGTSVDGWKPTAADMEAQGPAGAAVIARMTEGYVFSLAEGLIVLELGHAASALAAVRAVPRAGLQPNELTAIERLELAWSKTFAALLAQLRVVSE